MEHIEITLNDKSITFSCVPIVFDLVCHLSRQARSSIEKSSILNI